MPFEKTSIHNLPPQPTPFVGRKSEITDILERLRGENCRLLTLVGSGGIGKTRLAIESIQNLGGLDFEHGVFYIPLAPLTSADSIVTTIINALGILIGDEGTPQEELLKFLSQRNLLLVMDNFEHVLDGSSVVTAILNTALHVKILVTSRETLNLKMEHVWQVHGMRYPDSDEPADINQYDALNLFVERALQIRRDFSVGDEQLAVIQICQLVDGLPLAIELAAGWLKTLSCADIIKQIRRGIDFLATRNHDVPERHRSIRAVFDHSWDLLSTDEQAVFPRLSVFRGGFTLDAVEHVADATLITLSGLVEKSMVRRDASGRYDVHELLRQYGEENLQENGEVDVINNQHTNYFADFMINRAPDIKGKRQVESLHEIEADFDNILIAWQHAIHGINYEALDKMMETLALYCEMRALYQVGETLFDDAVNTLSQLNMNEVHPVFNRLRARFVQVWMLRHRYPIPEYIQQLTNTCLQIAESQKDNLTVIICCILKGMLLGFTNNLNEAMSYLDYALPLAEGHDAYYQGYILRIVDNLFTFQYYEDTPYTIEINRKNEQIARQISNNHGIADALSHKSNRLWRQGKYRDAEKFLRECTLQWEYIGDTKSIGVNTMTLGIHGFYNGEFTSAETLLFRGFQITSSVNFLKNHIIIYAHLSMIRSILGDYDEGYQLAEQMPADNMGLNSMTVKFFCNMAFTIHSIGISNFEFVKLHLAHSLAHTQGIGMLETFSIVLSSFWLHHNNENMRAVKFLGLVYNHPATRKGWMGKWNLLTQLQDDLRTELGEESYQIAWEHGKALDLTATVKNLQAELDGQSTSNLLSESGISTQILETNRTLIERLTERELEVLKYLGEGYSNREIAHQLTVVIGTVKAHVYNICQKLAVKNRTQAVIQAKKIGLL
jgi:predicted ATPase/DNA-binding CsgD family transcriptional regulator